MVGDGVGDGDGNGVGDGAGATEDFALTQTLFLPLWLHLKVSAPFLRSKPTLLQGAPAFGAAALEVGDVTLTKRVSEANPMRSFFN